MKEGSSLPTSVCCQHRNADGSGGCPGADGLGEHQDDDFDNFLCTNYPKGGFFSKRDAQGRLERDSEGLLIPTLRPMVSFDNKEMAITGCPTRSTKCGPIKTFEFRGGVF